MKLIIITINPSIIADGNNSNPLIKKHVYVKKKFNAYKEHKNAQLRYQVFE